MSRVISAWGIYTDKEKNMSDNMTRDQLRARLGDIDGKRCGSCTKYLVSINAGCGGRCRLGLVTNGPDDGCAKYTAGPTPVEIEQHKRSAWDDIDKMVRRSAIVQQTISVNFKGRFREEYGLTFPATDDNGRRTVNITIELVDPEGVRP